MKRLILTLAVLLCLPALSSAQQVTFARKLPPVGLQRAMIDSMEVVSLISVNAEGENQSFDMTQSERKSYTETVMAVNDERITKKKIHVIDMRSSSANPMAPPTIKDSPALGKTYILEYLNDSLAVTTESGDAVTGEEYRAMRDAFSRDSEGQFSTILDGRTMSIGETLVLNDEMLAAFGAQMTGGGMKVQRASLTLNGLRESQGMQTAMFDMDVVFSGAQGPMEMEITMKGTAEAGVENLWPLSLVMSGTLAGAGAHGGADLSADGKMTVAKIVTYK
jgi:hypothetical protein